MKMKQLIICSFSVQLLRSPWGSLGSALELMTFLETFNNTKLGLPSGFLEGNQFVLVYVQLSVGQFGNAEIECVLMENI